MTPTATYAWRTEAACLGLPPAWFVAADGHSERWNEACTVCNTCPVRRECARYALSVLNSEGGHLCGIWAGVIVSGPRQRAVARLTAVADEPAADAY